jgi:ribonuclease P protein component
MRNQHLDGIDEHKTLAQKGSQRFRPFERLSSSGDYQRVKREGKRLRTSCFVVSVASNDLTYHRLGLVVQKRFWKNAVRRNRVKRCLREWFRLNKNQIPLPGKDIVVIARPGAEKLSPQQIAEELLPGLGKWGNGTCPCGVLSRGA